MLRAAITDIFECLDMKRWEAGSAKFVKQIWMTDCKSLEQAFASPKCNKHSDKRLSIEIRRFAKSFGARPVRKLVTHFTTTTNQRMIR